MLGKIQGYKISANHVLNRTWLQSDLRRRLSIKAVETASDPHEGQRTRVRKRFVQEEIGSQLGRRWKRETRGRPKRADRLPEIAPSPLICLAVRET